MNTPVSFPIAKLLKEKGFNVKTQKVFYPNGEECDYYPYDNLGENNSYFWRPTISDVVMWLYEKDKIWITSEPFIKSDDIVVYIYKIFKNGYVDTISRASTGFNSLDQSYEAAIEYTLNNLI